MRKSVKEIKKDTIPSPGGTEDDNNKAIDKNEDSDDYSI